jgi:hypothetical protein
MVQRFPRELLAVKEGQRSGQGLRRVLRMGPGFERFQIRFSRRALHPAKGDMGLIVIFARESQGELEFFIKEFFELGQDRQRF